MSRRTKRRDKLIAAASSKAYGPTVSLVLKENFTDPQVKSECLWWAHALDLLQQGDRRSLQELIALQKRRIMALRAVEHFGTWKASDAIMGPPPGTSYMTKDLERFVLADLTVQRKLKTVAEKPS